MMRQDNAHKEDEEEVFEYPGDDVEEHDADNGGHDSENEFTYPASPTSQNASVESPSGPSVTSAQVFEQPKTVVRPTPAQLETLYSAGLSGNLGTLRQIVSNVTASGEIEAFALVNDASPRTGLTVVHACASRGHLGALRWCTLAMPNCSTFNDLNV